MKKFTLVAFISAIILIFGFQQLSWGQISISPGTTVTENFDGIGVTATATLPNYWKADKNITSRSVGAYSAAATVTDRIGGDNLSTTAGNGIYNYGAGDPTTATDRAVGGLSSGSASKSVNTYVWLANNGTEAISQFVISYNVEKYRHGSNAAGFSIQLYYSTDGINWTSAGPAFTTSFSADADNSGYMPAPGATVAVTAQNLMQAIEVGGSIYLAWNYSVTSGTTTSNAQALGVDDISITGTTGGNPVVATPTFNPGTGTYYSSQNIAISTTTEGASIYYTSDGSDPNNTGNGTLFTIPVSVSSTTTLKAIAYAGGYDPSAIATAIYTFPTINDVADIAALRAGLTDATIYRLTGEAILTFKTTARNAKYIQDATGAILIDDISGKITTTYTVYDGITGITGSLVLYSGMLQFVPVRDPGAASSTGNTVVPEEVTLANLTTDYQAKLVKIQSATITGTGDFVISTSYTLTDASGSGEMRTQYSDLDYIGTAIPVNPQNIVGVVLQYTTISQLIPRNLLDFSPTAGPVITASPTALSDFSYFAGSGPSLSQSYELSGSNLTGIPGEIAVSCLTNYEVSIDNSTFDASVTIPYTSGTLSPTIVYVRLKAGLASGSYNGELVTNFGGGIAIAVNVTCSGAVYPPEPTNHATDFAAGTTTISTIPLSWTDATGAVLPDAYLIKGSAVSYADIVDPSDGPPEANAALVQNVIQGTGNFTFTGLIAGTPYYFKIYSYASSGTANNYKPGTVPETTATTAVLPAGALLTEVFDYTAGENIGSNTVGSGGISNNWTTHSNGAATTGTIDIIQDNLSYAGLTASLGNKVLLPGNNTTTPRDVNRAIPGNTNTVMYYSALIQVIDNTQIKTTDDYFMSFGASAGISVASLGARLGIKSVNSAANYRLSVQNISAGTTTYTEFATDLNFGTTYLVVVKYDRSAIPTVASLWVNPASLGGVEPAGSVTNASGTNTFVAFSSICLRNSANTPKAYIDEIRVGSSWADVTPAGISFKTLNLTAVRLEHLFVVGSGGMMRQANNDTGPQFTAPTADVITIELRDANTYGTVLRTYPDVPLTQNGTASVTEIDLPDGNYRITIKHRNSIETTSMLGVDFTGATIAYSFGTAGSAFGNNLKLLDSFYCIYGGDVNQGGQVDGADVSAIENGVNSFVRGYDARDVDGSGDLGISDYTIWENNNNAFIQKKTP